ncbi:hypothetical protein EV426DRAFT_599078, partial [Tirmania nivea]
FIQLPTATLAADHDPEDLPVLENEISKEIKLADGQVTMVAMCEADCIRRKGYHLSISHPSQTGLRLSEILPSILWNLPTTVCYRLVPTSTVVLHFIPRTVLMVLLATRDGLIIDQSSMSIILPWYNIIYDPQQAGAISTAPLSPSESRRLQPLLSKEWPICLVRPHKYTSIYSNDMIRTLWKARLLLLAM